MPNIGRFEILDELGRGGMGVVYRAFDPALQRTLAIKVINANVEPELRARLLREAQAAARLRHPNIVTIYDVGSDRETLYIAMEFLEGKDLGALFKQGTALATERFLSILAGIAGALDYAHGQGLIHRDVKPSNIMVLTAGGEKLMDFGIAKGVNNDRLTRTGATLGTPFYMAPEQIRGADVDGRADQFSLAVVAYEGLAGHVPFQGENMGALVYNVLDAKFPPASGSNSNLNAETDSVLRRALSVEPQDRYRTCEEFVEALRSALTSMTGLLLPARGTSAGAAPAAVPPPAAAPPPPLGTFAASAPVPQVTALAAAAPTSFLNEFPRTGFFSGEQVRFEKIEESFRFFRKNLQDQYEALARQATLISTLWICCVALGFLVLIGGLAAMFFGDGKSTITKGTVTGAGTVLVYYIQRLFQQREDFYRKAAEEKNSHLEYGNKWLLVIQTVDAIQDPAERKRQQARIAEALTANLNTASPQPAKTRQRARTKSSTA